jgi:hypothetical protein
MISRTVRKDITAQVQNVTRIPAYFLAAHAVLAGVDPEIAMGRAIEVLARHWSDEPNMASALVLMQEMTV